MASEQRWARVCNAAVERCHGRGDLSRASTEHVLVSARSRHRAAIAQELGLLHSQAGVPPPTDEAVLESFTQSVEAGGFMREYLQHGQLVAMIGSSLYMHGGLISAAYSDSQDSALGYIPGRSERVPTVEEWIVQLNAWCKQQAAAGGGAGGRHSGWIAWWGRIGWSARI